MARRKDHTREELINMAIQAGKKLVRSSGPEGLTARRIALEMGYAPGTLYNLFETIDDLVVAINAESLETFADDMRVRSRKARTPRGRLRKLAEAYLAFQDSEPHLWSLLFATPMSQSSESYRLAVRMVFDQVEEVMQSFSRNKSMARQNAKILWATLHGICLLSVSGKLNVVEVDSRERLVASFLDQFPKDTIL